MNFRATEFPRVKSEFLGHGISEVQERIFGPRNFRGSRVNFRATEFPRVKSEFWGHGISEGQE